VRVELYDVDGKAVKIVEINAAETAKPQLDLSGLNNGLYLIRVKAIGEEKFLPLLPDATKRVVVHGLR